MLNVGLTGGIGAGKTAVSSRLAARGAIVIDSDVLAREVVAPHTGGHAEILETFGPTVIGEDGHLDRAALAKRVFDDVQARTKLENIIHPRVRERSWQLLMQAPDDAIVVNDVPLLVEVGLAPTFDMVIVVTAARDLRMERLQLRGLDAHQAQARIDAQASDAERDAAADVIIDNSSDIDSLTDTVNQLYSERLIPYERNKRNRVTVCDAAQHRNGDATGRMRRLHDRIRHVLGTNVRSVDAEMASGGAARVHVGLAADVQMEEVHATLDAAGFFKTDSFSGSGAHGFCGSDPHNPCQILLHQS